mmetsp:Transcript_20657/g.30913  ORF Transcript_20657/g.30913 Transcript_20657/m.30913 type:complete len:255 (-) Transcript_20657:85-849(-)
MAENRKRKRIEDDCKVIEKKHSSMSEEIKEADKDSSHHLDILMDIKNSVAEIQEKEEEEIAAIQQKYSNLKTPLMLSRRIAIEGITRFWRTVFEYHPILQCQLEDVDLEILESLLFLQVTDIEDSRFSIILDFRENRFFSPARFVKSFRLCGDGDDEDELSIENRNEDEKNSEEHVEIVNSEIQWTNQEFLKDHPDSFFVQFFMTKQHMADIVEIFRNDLWEDLFDSYLQALSRKEELELESTVPELVVTYSND